MPFFPLGVLAFLAAFQPWIFYISLPSRLTFVIGEPIHVYEMVDKPYEQLTQKELKVLGEKIRQQWQQQLLDACAAYEALHAPTPGPSGIPFSTKAARVRIEGDVPVDLGDTVRVVNAPWGVNISTRIYAMTFDAATIAAQ